MRASILLLSAGLGGSLVGCSPADAVCDARDLSRDEPDTSLQTGDSVEETLELGEQGSVTQHLRLTVGRFPSLGTTFVERFDSEMFVQFQTSYAGSVPAGAELPEITYAVDVRDGVRATTTSSRGNGSLSVPIFGCGTSTNHGVDDTCCPIGQANCELDVSVTVTQKDLLFPKTMTSYTLEAKVGLLSCMEDEVADVDVSLEVSQ